MIDPHGPGVDYRQTVAPWFRSIFALHPDISAMEAAPLRFHIHVLIGMLLFILVPFTRLVHMFTAPLHYLFRPYIVYRSRDGKPTSGGSHRSVGADRHERWSPSMTTAQQPASALRAGQTRNLVLATLAFRDHLLGLEPDRTARRVLRQPRRNGSNASQKSILIAVPILVGSLGRIVVGVLTPRFGGRVMFTALLLLSVPFVIPSSLWPVS